MKLFIFAFGFLLGFLAAKYEEWWWEDGMVVAAIISALSGIGWEAYKFWRQERDQKEETPDGS